MAVLFYREKTGPGAWVRATGSTPFDITGLTGDIVYEIEDGSGTLIERTPTQIAPTVTGTISDLTVTEGVGGTRDASTAFSAFIASPWIDKFSISPATTGVSINPATGLVTIGATAIVQAGTVLTVTAENSAGAVTSTFGLTVESAALVPTLSLFSVTDTSNGVITLTVDMDSTVRFWVGNPATTPTAQEIWDGTGADATVEKAVTSGTPSYTLTLPATLDGTYRVSVVGRIGAGALSNVETDASVAIDTVPAPFGTDPLFADWFGDQTRGYSTIRTLLAPVGTRTGDMLILVLNGNYPVPASVTPPAGFTNIGTLVDFGTSWFQMFVGTATADGAGSYNVTFPANTEHHGFVMRFDPGGTVANFSTTNFVVASSDFSSGTISGLTAGDLVVKIGLLDSLGLSLTVDGVAPDIYDTPNSGSATLGVTVGVEFETVVGTASTEQFWNRPQSIAAAITFSIAGA